MSDVVFVAVATDTAGQVRIAGAFPTRDDAEAACTDIESAERAADGWPPAVLAFDDATDGSTEAVTFCGTYTVLPCTVGERTALVPA